ncbi:hypothetical protein C8Q76DRAFT_853142 [Earliella scabrosa]|nr:hypothetical protein C8Q76DRAFT_853142 [Earliella scabrosa]
MSDEDQARQVGELYYPAFVLIYYAAGSAALLLYDCSLTFTDEVQRIWKRRFSGVTVVYLLIRYTVLFNRILVFLEFQAWNDRTGPTICKLLERSTDVSTILSGFALAVLIILRVYAVWGRDWRPLVIVAPLSLVDPVVRLLSAISARIMHEDDLNLSMCTEDNAAWLAAIYKPLSVAAVVSTVLANCILVILTWYKTFQIRTAVLKMQKYDHPRPRPPIAWFLFRDGTVYFALTFTNTLVQLFYILQTTLSTTEMHAILCIGFWLSFSPTFTVIVLSRFILGLRGLYFSDSDPPVSDDAIHEYPPGSGAYTPVPSTAETRQSLLSSSRLLGNLGATVDIPTDDSERAGMEDHDEEDEEDEVPQFSRYPFVTGLEDCVEGRIMKYGYAV